jgi:hexosaminidase
MPRDAIVQVWMGDALDVERVMRAGQRVIFSSCWYLDYINYGMDWDKYYMCEQLSTCALVHTCNELVVSIHKLAASINVSVFIVTAQQMEQYGITNLTMLVGGEACLWTEFADNSDIMARLWYVPVEQFVL